MSLIVGLLATCLHAAPSTFAIGFALTLVFWLVMAEEGELRRSRGSGAEADRAAAVAGAPLAPSSTV